MTDRPPLYLDECVNQGVVPELRARRFAVTLPQSVAMLGEADDLHLAFAAANDLLLITHNRRHFVGLHRYYMIHALSHGGLLALPNGPVGLLTLRVAIAVDWIAAHGEYRSRLFRWNDVQQGLIAGERVEGYTEEEHRRAIGQLGKLR